MKTILANPVFIVAERLYTWRDVILAAQLRGDWDALLLQLRQGLACHQRLVADGQTVERALIERAMTNFRYEYNLISAQDAADWLRRWGLTVELWMNYFRREILRTRWAAELAEIVEHFPVTATEIEEHLKAEAVFSGSLGNFALSLAHRAAAEQRTAAQDGPALALDTTINFASEYLTDLAPEDVCVLLQHLQGLETVYGQYREALLTPPKIRRIVQQQGLEWMQVCVQSLAFATEVQAREAALCVTADGMTLAEVAAASHHPLQQGEFYLDEVEPSLRELLLGAALQELLGPIWRDEAFYLFLILEKRPPLESDPDIQQRAQQAILDQAHSADLNQYVIWRHSF